MEAALRWSGHAMASRSWTLRSANIKTSGPGTHDQEMRGCRPAVCRICGLDMSVDSGD